ncbi:MAG: ABC transporter permease subunit [Thermodesulfobacteriota bacterium]
MDTFDLIIKYHQALLGGLKVTLSLCLIVWASGILIGGLFGAIGAAQPKTIGRPLEFISYFVRAIPVLVLLFWFHYPFQYLLGITIAPFITAAITLSLMNIVLTSDLVRGVLLQFPESYVEAAKVCGLKHTQAVLHIKLPILLRELIPQIMGLMILMLQMSLFASLISVEELFRVAQRINSIEYKPVEIYTGMAFFFVLICLPINAWVTWLQSRFQKMYSSQRA